jgi:Ca2+-binding EF-hand superfamily protein
MDNELWEQLLLEADKNKDGVVSFEEFSESMGSLIRKNLQRKRSNTNKN